MQSSLQNRECDGKRGRAELDRQETLRARHFLGYRAPKIIPHVGTFKQQLAKATGGRRFEAEQAAAAEIWGLLDALSKRRDLARTVAYILRLAEEGQI
jgi:hypothetical protein